jgi:hypothetical protein
LVFGEFLMFFKLLNKMRFYQMKIFNSDLTLKSGFEALERLFGNIDIIF